MQRKREQRAIDDASEPKRAVFSRNEKLIAKFGLGAGVATLMLFALHQTFPNMYQITTALAYAAASVLVLAALCVLAKPAEATATGVKRVAGCAVRFAKSRGIGVKTVRENTFANKRGTRPRTRARSRAFRSRRSRASTAGSSSDSSRDSDSSGEPPAPYPNTTPRLFQPHSVKKSHIAPSPKSVVSLPDCWRLPSRKIRRCF